MKKTLILLMVPLLILGVNISVFASTITQWKSSDGGNDHWYEVVQVEQSITWTEAYNAAVAAAENMWTGTSNLASMNLSGENTFVSGLVNDYSWAGKGYGPWLGGEGTFLGNDNWSWEWIDGETWNESIAKWADGQPNGVANDNMQTNEVFYLHYLWANADGSVDETWNDTTDDPHQDVFGYVVEYTGSPVPEPATMFLVGLGLLGISGVCRKRA